MSRLLIKHGMRGIFGKVGTRVILRGVVLRGGVNHSRRGRTKGKGQVLLSQSKGRRLLGGGRGMRMGLNCGACENRLRRNRMRLLGWRLRWKGLRLRRLGLRVGVGDAVGAPKEGGGPSVEGGVVLRGEESGRSLRKKFRVFQGSHLRRCMRHNAKNGGRTMTALHGNGRSLVGERLKTVA
ncbi:hypothetical protein LIER_26280 [Lithospermum erythrorhizon]|uniref:Uncharacterized protein n=1 Tax=Lithospermum erythrorhizon TaxID=34254 RepID=A0AAV3RAU2_LITER